VDTELPNPSATSQLKGKKTSRVEKKMARDNVIEKKTESGPVEGGFQDNGGLKKRKDKRSSMKGGKVPSLRGTNEQKGVRRIEAEVKK